MAVVAKVIKVLNIECLIGYFERKCITQVIKMRSLKKKYRVDWI